jgi:hypothetical protein
MNRASGSPAGSRKPLARATPYWPFIGPTWLTITDEAGRRRLDNPEDLVRLEIATALGRGDDVLVIPVLLGPTSMPAAADLPKPLASLAERNAVRITDESWGDQVARLTRAVEKVVKPRVVAPVPFHLAAPQAEGGCVYDSATEPEAFQDWSYFAERGNISLAWDTFPRDASERVMGMVAVDKEAVGLNKSLRLLSGVVEFEYRVASFDAIVNQVYFAVIPMEETGIGRKGLIELGADVQDDPRNPRSVYRRREFVPGDHYRDHAWHSCRIPFDFTNHDRAFYCIFAPRINEGLERRGDAEVHVRNVKVWATSR